MPETSRVLCLHSPAGSDVTLYKWPLHVSVSYIILFYDTQHINMFNVPIIYIYTRHVCMYTSTSFFSIVIILMKILIVSI